LPVSGTTVCKPFFTGAASGLVSATPATSSTAFGPSQTDWLGDVKSNDNCPGIANPFPPESAERVIEPPGATIEPKTVTCAGEPRPILAPASPTIDAPAPTVTPPVTPA